MHVDNSTLLICIIKCFVGKVIKRIYFVCCRDGNYYQSKKPRLTEKRRPHKKDTKKLNDTCISRMYVDYFHDGNVTVTHVTAHTNHTPGLDQEKYLPIPKSKREDIAIKINNGTPTERILEGEFHLQHNKTCRNVMANH